MLLSELGGERQDASDVIRSYQKTYVYVKVNNQERVAFIDYVARDKVSLKFFGGEEVSVPWEEVDILYIMPESGVYQLDDGVAIARRLPLRQWKKGVTSDNMYVHTYYSGGEECVYKHTDARDVNHIPFSVAERLFMGQKDQHLKEAIQKVEDTTVPQRVCNKFWVKKERSRCALFHNRIRVGSWEMDTFFWYPPAKILKEELNDYLGQHA